MRDDFSESVKRALTARVGHLCSNSECRGHTTGPHLNVSKVLNIGVAGHINAASPGGPRFDANQDPSDRGSIENGIWLCQKCAKLVDSDPARFPADLLKGWKRDAEDEAYRRLGRPTEPTPSSQIEDEWCTHDYVQRAGIAGQLEDAGYRLLWSNAGRVPERMLDGWEEVVWEQPDGRLVRFKIRGRLSDDQVLLRKPNV